MIFATYTNWFSRELEKADPDLTGNTKPPNMSDKDWLAFQAVKSQRQSTHGGESAAGGSGAGGSGQAGGDHEARIANLFEIIKKWENNFSRHLQILLDALNHYAATETVVLLSLCARLATANQGTEYAGLRNEEEAGL
jgi:gamma-tubulin complex component 2